MAEIDLGESWMRKCRRNPARARAFLLVLAAVVGLVGCGVADPQLTMPQPGAAEPSGSILFVSNRQVFVWDGDVRQVTEDVHARSPRWAPDGERFAYVRVHDAYSDLVLANRNGGELWQITDNQPSGQPGTYSFVRYAYWAADPAWAPDGQLAFTSDRGGWEAGPSDERYSDPMFIWYADNLDTPPYILRASAYIGLPQESPTFSPDGSALAFVVRTGPPGSRKNEIWTMALNGGATSVLVSGQDVVYDPAWSPDGQSIAFVQRTNEQHDIWIAPLDGSEPYQLTDIGAYVSPVWSPDGQFLAFFRLNDDNQFEAWYVAVTRGPDGRLQASEPHKLFEADNIDTTSGMSWSAAG